MRNFRQNRGVFSLFMLIGLAVIVAAIMLLWNYLIPSIIGWTTINYWQALDFSSSPAYYSVVSMVTDS